MLSGVLGDFIDGLVQKGNIYMIGRADRDISPEYIKKSLLQGGQIYRQLGILPKLGHGQSIQQQGTEQGIQLLAHPFGSLKTAHKIMQFTAQELPSLQTFFVNRLPVDRRGLGRYDASNRNRFRKPCCQFFVCKAENFRFLRMLPLVIDKSRF